MMTQRERFLAIAVGVVVALLLANVGFKKITNTISLKEKRVEKAQSELDSLNSAIESGKRAFTKIERLESRSLPRKEEDAKTQYTDWLYQLAKEVGLGKVKVDPKGSPQKIVPVGSPPGAPEAYTVHEFQLVGECQTDKVVELLAKYYDRDYLHRIKVLQLNPTKQTNLVTVELTSQAVSLPKAPDNKEPSLQPSGRLAMSTDAYKQKILERNAFSPPNNAPKIETGRSHDVTIGQPWKLDLDAKDPDGNNVKFELVTEKDDLPKDFNFQGKEISWKPTEKLTEKIVVRAIDDGWPKKSTEMELTLKAIDAPAPKVETPPTVIDPAKQAFLTGVVDGPTGQQGWINSKAEGINIDITEGTEINVGTIKAKVMRIDFKASLVELETDGSVWIADMNTSLADAFAKSRVD